MLRIQANERNPVPIIVIGRSFMSQLIGFHIWDYLPSRRNMIFPKKTRSCHISTGLLNPKDILSRLIEAVWVYFVIWWITFRAQAYCLPMFNLQTLTVISKNVITSSIQIKIWRMNREMNRLKVVLAETKRTNWWLAEQLGKDQATVSKWYTNTSQPSLETLFQIAECLGVTVQELISKNSTKDHE